MLAAAKAAGADAADAIAVDGTSLSVDVLNGRLEQAERAEGVEIGLRVMVGQRQASVSASDTRPDTLREMAERAVGMATACARGPDRGPRRSRHAEPGSRCRCPRPRRSLRRPHAPALEDAALRAEAAALAVKGISQVQSASAGFSRRRIHLAASNGFSGGYARSSHGLVLRGHHRRGAGDGAGLFRRQPHPCRRPDGPRNEVGRIAAERTVERAGARKPPTGAFPVVYHERISSGLIGHLLSAINGRPSPAARPGRATFWGAGPSKGAEPDRRPAAPARRRLAPLRCRGAADRAPRHRGRRGPDGLDVLDLATARKLGLPSTANAARGTGGPPSPSVSNAALTQGEQTLDALLAEMGTGLLITSMIGSSINATTGDYSRGASGFWVENGEIAYPVNECTVAGNLRDMLIARSPPPTTRGPSEPCRPVAACRGIDDCRGLRPIWPF
jgi:PmbA protein